MVILYSLVFFICFIFSVFVLTVEELKEQKTFFEAKNLKEEEEKTFIIKKFKEIKMNEFLISLSFYNKRIVFLAICFLFFEMSTFLISPLFCVNLNDNLKELIILMFFTLNLTTIAVSILE